MRGSAGIRLMTVAMAGLATYASATYAQSPEVTASVNVNLPGVYGQITIGGGAPAPELLLSAPVVAVPPPSGVIVAEPPPPLYLHVPPGHEKHWAKHCHEYHACGRPVYFVSDRWYNEVYAPQQRAHADEHWDRRDEEYHDHGRGHGRDHERDHEHGHGHERNEDR